MILALAVKTIMTVMTAKEIWGWSKSFFCVLRFVLFLVCPHAFFTLLSIVRGVYVSPQTIFNFQFSNLSVLLFLGCTVVGIAIRLSLAAGITAVKTRWFYATIVGFTTRNTGSFPRQMKHASHRLTCSRLSWRVNSEMKMATWWMEN